MLLGMDGHPLRSIVEITQTGFCSRRGKFSLILAKG